MATKKAKSMDAVQRQINALKETMAREKLAAVMKMVESKIDRLLEG